MSLLRAYARARMYASYRNIRRDPSSVMVRENTAPAGRRDMMEGNAMTYFADDGYLDTKCSWCGKPAADGEEIEVVQVSSREALWMHLNCEKQYSEFCKKEHENFYAVEVLKFVRGEAAGIKPGTVGEAKAKIAKNLIAKNPSLALPENLQELIATVEAASGSSGCQERSHPER